MSEYTEVKTMICKANPLGKSQKIADQIIAITRKLPEGLTLAESEQFHHRQATIINKALSESLPRGTYDRLGIMFMQHKVSLYQGRTETAF